MDNVIEMPKHVNIEVLQVGLFWRIAIRGVLLKRTFWTKKSAIDYIPEIHNYFGDECTFILKEVA